MKTKRKPIHLYSVFTHTSEASTKAYFGSSEAAALRAFAYAIVRNPQASSVELRRDLKPWLRVSVQEVRV